MYYCESCGAWSPHTHRAGCPTLHACRAPSSRRARFECWLEDRGLARTQTEAKTLATALIEAGWVSC